MRFRWSAILILGCVLVASRPVGAQQVSPGFTEAYNKGVDAFRLGKYDEARTHLEAAKAIDPTLPGPWRFLAAVAEAEGKFDECVASAREAIRVNPQSTEIERTRQLHDGCREKWGKPPFTGAYDPGQGALAVTTDQPGAMVEVNGIKYGSAPLLPRALPAGEVEVVVEKTGFLRAAKKTVILENVVTDVDFVMEVDPDAEQPDLGPAPEELTVGWIVVDTPTPGAEVLIDGKALTIDAQGRYEVEQGTREVTVRAPDHEPQTHTVRVTKGTLARVRVALRSQRGVDRNRSIGTALVGGGLGVAAIGAVTGILSVRAADEARDIWVQETTRPTGVGVDTSAVPVRTRAEMEDKVAQSERFALISTISYGVAAAAVVVGGYFLVKGRPFKEQKRRMSLVPLRDGAGGVGAAAGWEVRW